MTKKTFELLLGEAKSLKAGDGSNPEYDRALCELIARVAGGANCPEAMIGTEEGAVAIAATIGVTLA